MSSYFGFVPGVLSCPSGSSLPDLIHPALTFLSGLSSRGPQAGGAEKEGRGGREEDEVGVIIPRPLPWDVAGEWLCPFEGPVWVKTN